MWIFPELLTTRTEKEQATKVIDEANEFLETPTDNECVDIFHSVETLLRIRFKGRKKEMEEMIKQVIEKNTKRNYYSKKVY